MKAEFQKLAQAQLGELAEMVPEKTGKYDSYLPENLQLVGYVSQFFDISATQKWLQQFAETKPELSKA